MSRVEKCVYIVVVVVVLVSGLTYGLLKNSNEVKDNTIEKVDKEDGIELLKIRSSGIKTIEEFEVVLNGKSNKMEITFLYQLESKYVSANMAGWFNNLLVSYEEKDGLTYEHTDEEFLNRFSEDNVRIIKGKDGKNYLLVWAKLFSEHNGDDKLYIFNDNLELISDDSFKYYSCVQAPDKFMTVHSDWQYAILDDESIWYKDELGVCKDDKYKKCHINVKVEDDKIYYLVPVISYNEDDFGYVEERVYQIRNNKLDYEVLNTKRIKKLVNSLC